LGEDVIPPEVEVEAEPWGRARRRPPSEAEVGAEPWGRARRRPPSEAEVEADPQGSGEAEISFRGRGLRSGEAELPVAPEAELGCCQPHPGGWHSSRSGASGAVFLSGRSVEGQSDAVTSTLPTEARVSG
jgi:hypothetical protein